jgi:hypothetical protein
MKITRKGNRVRVRINAADPDELAYFLDVVSSLPPGFALPPNLLSDLEGTANSTSISSLLAFARKHPGPFERE